MSEVTDLLDKLASGRVTLGAVAADFVTRAWVTKERTRASSYGEAAAREMEDPESIPEGSWGEVESAYVSGQISHDQYRILFAAKTGSMDDAPPER